MRICKGENSALSMYNADRASYLYKIMSSKIYPIFSGNKTWKFCLWITQEALWPVSMRGKFYTACRDSTTQGIRIVSWSLPTLLITLPIFFFAIITAVIDPPPFISRWRWASLITILPSQAPTSRAVIESLFSLRCPISSTSHFILIKNHIITIGPSPSPLFVGLCRSVLSFLLQIWDTPKATALIGTLGIGLFSPCIWQARYLLYNLAWQKC